MKQQIGLLYEQPSGELCSILKATLEEQGVQDYVLAVCSLSKQLPGLRAVVNGHVVTALVIQATHSTVHGYKLEGRSS